MGWKSHGFRFKSGRKLRKRVREKGIRIRKVLQEFEIGQRVNIDIEPAVHKGMPHPRFQGRTGEVIGIRGKCYLVRVRDGGMYKTLIVRPEHLKA
ncbi:LSU ribosomal protein L21E [Archaeoglobus sulfaticallidus PM70-1]|uniref:Large ribosomal subunit protein eL21 n=1 Tax=Archaeoglobus sulfaticallidus PM70-1 TaxID=387631 RepID=N0BC82_9EURY|nr:50S ribosomal protein L21e [Archaeoglobus sulfaticallidus]AGK60593.1 LSU ribosomal protein L21E [Archaeoglobus sulfaticallidus PM70-1]